MFAKIVSIIYMSLTLIKQAIDIIKSETIKRTKRKIEKSGSDFANATNIEDKRKALSELEK